MRYTPMSDDEWRELEDFSQFLRWAGTPHNPGPHRFLAESWYSGLLTIEEGIRIEEGRQVWQPSFLVEVK